MLKPARRLSNEHLPHISQELRAKKYIPNTDLSISCYNFFPIPEQIYPQ